MIWKTSKIKRKVITYLIILSIVLGLVAGCGSKSNQEVVASVDGEKISKDDLYNELVKLNGQQALDSLISQKIVELEAKKQSIEISDSEIQKEMEKYYEYYGGQEGFLQALEMNGYSLDDVKKDLATNIKVKKLMEPRISITEEEKEKYFEENKAEFAQEKQVKASHILVDTLEKANEVEEKLASGGDFAQLAQEYSTDAATKENGGDLGFFGAGEMVTEFEEAAFSLNVGEVSEPVKTEYGYHIIKVNEKKDAKEANYEESKSKITETLLEQKIQTEYSSWMQELRQQYKIENYLEKK